MNEKDNEKKELLTEEERWPLADPVDERQAEKRQPPKHKYWLHLLLFVITFLTTTLAGAEWRFGRFLLLGDFAWEDFTTGLAFSLPFLTFLTVHEFGHFLTAKRYKVQASLPYFIPFWFGGIIPSIGTMGAVIRIREFIKSRKQHFDIGIAGPLAGFVVALVVLAYGFTHLPAEEYIYQVHPEYQEMENWQTEAYVVPDTAAMAGQMYLGRNLLYMGFEEFVAPADAFVPNPYEIIHYPWLFAGFLALFFTALNLLPIGQLDGGHILYGLVGYWKHRYIATFLFLCLVFWGGLGMVTPFDSPDELLIWGPLYAFFLYYLLQRLDMQTSTRWMLALTILAGQLLISYMYPTLQGYNGWLLFAFLIGRVLGVYHPLTPINEPLSPMRQVLGWLSLLIFVLSFSPQPFMFV